MQKARAPHRRLRSLSVAEERQKEKSERPKKLEIYGRLKLSFV